MHRDKKFEKITKDLQAMSKVTFKQLQLIKSQLEGEDLSAQEEDFTHNELILDSLEVKIKKNVTNAIILYGPRATDLRKIMSCYDITSSLERTGDLALNVHGYLNRVDSEGIAFTAIYKKLHELLSVAETMTKNAIYAFSCEDLQLTKETIELDDVADSLHREIGQELITLASNNVLLPQQAIDILSLSRISYNLERIADNATNMAEAAVYLVEGKNIQHSHNSYVEDKQ